MNGGLRTEGGNGQRFNESNATIPGCENQPLNETVINAFIVVQPKNSQFTIRTAKAEESQSHIMRWTIWKPFAEAAI